MMLITTISQRDEHARVDNNHQEPLPAEALGKHLVDPLG